MKKLLLCAGLLLGTGCAELAPYMPPIVEFFPTSPKCDETETFDSITGQYIDRTICLPTGEIQ